VTELSLPIHRVLVMEDRAQVERRGMAQVTGLTRLVVDGISPLAVDKSLTTDIKGATFIDAHLKRVAVEVPVSGLADTASELKRKAHALGLELQAAADAELEASRRPDQLLAARAQVLSAIARSTGFGTSNPDRWVEQLATLRHALEAADTTNLLAQRHRAALERTANELRAALSATERELQTRCKLHLALEGHGQAEISVRYLVPCAAWRPTYVATLSSGSTPTVHIEAEGLVWQRTQEDWSNVQLALSTARPTLGTTPPNLTEDRLRLRPKSSAEKKTLDVSLREEVIQTTGEGGQAPGLPGVDDGGETQQLVPPAHATVPADGRPHRVPLFRFEAPATLERVCVAELSPLVNLVARFSNSSGRVLLAGPAQLIHHAGAIGRTLLPFTAAGETAKLPFGASDSVRVQRVETEKTDEAMLTGKRTTVHTITLHVSNAGADPAQFVIEERVPVSEVKEVEVELVRNECNPPPGPVSPDGLTQLECVLPAHGTKQASFVWKMVAASKVSGM
jgi:uncharacterized protein (TIGR02231 family)